MNKQGVRFPGLCMLNNIKFKYWFSHPSQNLWLNPMTSVTENEIVSKEKISCCAFFHKNDQCAPPPSPTFAFPTMFGCSGPSRKKSLPWGKTNGQKTGTRPQNCVSGEQITSSVETYWLSLFLEWKPEVSENLSRLSVHLTIFNLLHSFILTNFFLNITLFLIIFSEGEITIDNQSCTSHT